MFEHTLLAGERRPWSFAASLTLQCGVVASILLLSLWHVESIPTPVFRYIVPQATLDRVQMVPVPNRDQLGTGSGHVASASRDVKQYLAPTKNPTAMPVLSDETELSLAPTTNGSVFGDVAQKFGMTANNVRIDPPPPPPPVVKRTTPEARPWKVGGNVLEAQIIRRVLPVYPPLAKQARISGKVELLGVIGKDGQVQDLQVISGHPLLVRAALEAVKQWLYRPTLLNGEPVQVTAPILVQFTLSQ